MSGDHLRPAVGLILVVLAPYLAESGAVLVCAMLVALLAYVVARVLVLFEPQARRFIVAHPLPLWWHIGEALFVSLALVMTMLALPAVGIEPSLGVGTVIAVAYLLLHTLVLGLGEGMLSETSQPAWPRTRRGMAVATFVAEEAVLLAACMSMQGAREGMAIGPWSPVDTLTLPLFSIAVLVVCYVPISRISRAAGDPERSPIDAIVVQIAALYVFALTGQLLL